MHFKFSRLRCYSIEKRLLQSQPNAKFSKWNEYKEQKYKKTVSWNPETHES